MPQIMAVCPLCKIRDKNYDASCSNCEMRDDFIFIQILDEIYKIKPPKE
jgi:uncharacterized protein YjaG (DUF416 family)